MIERISRVVALESDGAGCEPCGDGHELYGARCCLVAFSTFWKECSQVLWCWALLYWHDFVLSSCLYILYMYFIRFLWLFYSL